jgi:hypothetical protein
MQSLKLRITGESPLLMHSDRFANPLDPDAKAHKVLTSKRNKTDEDHQAIAISEWKGALYYDEEIGPYLPSANVRATLVDGAKLSKLGKAIQRGTLILADKLKLDYPGPRNPIEMVRDSRFIDCRSVVVSGKRLMRYRPVFPKWAFSVEVLFDPLVVERDQIMNSMSQAGLLIGLGDFRPNKGGSFGRFSVAME